MNHTNSPERDAYEIWERRNRSRSKLISEDECSIFDSSKNNGDKSVLEIGCDTGTFTKKLCRHFKTVTVVDISPQALKVCAEDKSSQLRLIQNNGKDLADVTDASIDIIFSTNLFHWLSVEQFAGYLRDGYRVLKNNGEIIFSIVVPHSLSTNMPDIFMYSIQSVVDAALKAGFMVRECKNDQTLPPELGLVRYSIELVRSERPPQSLSEIQHALSPLSVEKSTRVLLVDDLDCWNLIEEACRAHRSRDRDTFNALLHTIRNQKRSLSSDLAIAIESLTALGVEKPVKLAQDLLHADKKRITEGYQQYFGLTPGGVDLLSALNATEPAGLNRLRSLVLQVLQKKGRIFCMGNGGSFDNARLIAKAFGALGCAARIPGDGDSFFEGDYAQSFKAALLSEKIGQNDLIVGLSGSGNSPNIVEAFTYAMSCGTPVFALGGRDGGQMRKVVGDGASLVAKSSCMEAIEDIHYAVGLIVAESIAWEEEPTAILRRFSECLSFSLTESTVNGFSFLASELLRTIKQNSNVFVVGSGVGANHFRADAQRGFTNGVPLRGICAPELYTTNSGMATANDDGADFLLIDGLAKYRPSRSDLALLMDFPGQGERISLARSWLTTRGTSCVTLGPKGSDIDFSSFIENFNAEFIGSFAAHATGVVLREILWEKWGVRELSGIEKTLSLGDQRKLSFENAAALRIQLVREKVIGEHETITFCYGKVFAALDPQQFGLEVGYY